MGAEHLGAMDGANVEVEEASALGRIACMLGIPEEAPWTENTIVPAVAALVRERNHLQENKGTARMPKPLSEPQKMAVQAIRLLRGLDPWPHDDNDERATPSSAREKIVTAILRDHDLCEIMPPQPGPKFEPISPAQGEVGMRGAVGLKRGSDVVAYLADGMTAGVPFEGTVVDITHNYTVPGETKVIYHVRLNYGPTVRLPPDRVSAV